MHKGKKVVHIAARGLNGEIGANNKLLWSIPEDLRFFKESTIGHVVLMGRNTFEGLPKVLKNRITLQVTSQAGELEDFLLEGVDLSFMMESDKIFIAGGAKLFNTTFDLTDELWITQVGKEYPEADTYYHIPSGFKMIEEVYGNRCEEVGIEYSFQKWVKM